MADYFADSSALVKRYVSEVGSTWVAGLFNPSLRNEISGVEIVAAIARRARGGAIATSDAASIYSQLRSDWVSDYQVVEVNDLLLQQAMSLAEAHGLRGYDAVQLAAGCQVNQISVRIGLSPVVFISADNELNAAAAREGLAVDNPNLHP